MAYVVLVNPAILAEAGVPFEGALFATCVAAATATLVMGLVANYRFTLAPGMGLNAYFAYAVVGGLGIPWQTALGAVFLSGLVFLLLTIGRLRAVIPAGSVFGDFAVTQPCRPAPSLDARSSKVEVRSSKLGIPGPGRSSEVGARSTPPPSSLLRPPPRRGRPPSPATARAGAGARRTIARPAR
jgi:hypothetical protein